MTLQDYFDSITPFEYGVMDCCLFPSNWILSQTGNDPAKGLRFGPISEDFAEGIIADNGGLLRLFEKRFTSAGLRRTKTPQNGDVACIRYQKTAYGSVMKDGLWWVVAKSGKFPILQAKLIRAWSFKCRK